MDITTVDQRLLDDLLTTLVNRWGYDTVRGSLQRVSGEAGRMSVGEHAFAKERTKAVNNKKPTAVGFLEKLNFDHAKREALTKLATQYDRKLFLPRTADVREFLHMRGQPTQVSDRTMAIRTVFHTLAHSPKEELELLVTLPGGPSELGPISDAIKLVNAEKGSESTRFDAEQADEN